MITTKFCPYCEEEKLVTHHIEDTPMVYQGETFLCTAEWFTCFSCGGEFEESKSKYDPMAEAMAKYNQMKGK